MQTQLTDIGVQPFKISKLRRVLEIIEALSAPLNLAAPAISGTPKVGETLLASQGTWDPAGSTITAFSFQWFRGGSPIVGATASSYEAIEDDIDEELRVEVAATNAIGTTARFSDPTGRITPADSAPVNTALPTIAGIARSGETLAASSNGTWTGNGEELLDFDYQWLADDVVMPGETGTTLDLTDTEIGQRISLRVTATNSIGSTAATSLQTAAVVAPINYPGIVSAPIITGTLKVPNVLTASQGTWNAGGSAITGYTYQWFADDVAIGGATNNTFTLTSAQDNAVLRVEVTATNSAGSVTATSNSTAPIEPEVIAPVNTTQPTIFGTVRAGQEIACDREDWYDGGATISYTYEWERLSDGLPIAGATAALYTLTQTDVGDRVRCKVTATNSAGSTDAYTAYTTLVALPLPPVNTAAPALSYSDLYVDTVISVSDGTWNGNGFAVTIAYQWQANGVDIAGATNNTYTLLEADIGKRIRCVVKATNIGGTTSYTTPQTAQVSATPLPPTNTVAPSISGNAYIEAVLTANNGTWEDNGFAISGYTYQWLADDVEISGATNSTFTVTEAEDGTTITVEVTATNSVGSTPEVSSGFGPINGYEPLAPTNTALPEITGGFVAVGVELSASTGTWDDNYFAISGYTYKWLADDVEISGATSATFTPTGAELGTIITVEVTATNANGATAAESVATVPVGNAPIDSDLVFDYAIEAAGEINAIFVFDYAIAS